MIDLSIKFLGTVGGLGQRTKQGDWDMRLEVFERLRVINQRGGQRKPVLLPERAPVGLKPKTAYSPKELKDRMAAVRAAKLP
jgi:hypothetical protein